VVKAKLKKPCASDTYGLFVKVKAPSEITEACGEYPTYLGENDQVLFYSPSDNQWMIQTKSLFTPSPTESAHSAADVPYSPLHGKCHQGLPPAITIVNDGTFTHEALGVYILKHVNFEDGSAEAKPYYWHLVGKKHITIRCTTEEWPRKPEGSEEGEYHWVARDETKADQYLFLLKGDASPTEVEVAGSVGPNILTDTRLVIEAAPHEPRLCSEPLCGKSTLNRGCRSCNFPFCATCFDKHLCPQEMVDEIKRERDKLGRRHPVSQVEVSLEKMPKVPTEPKIMFKGQGKDILGYALLNKGDTNKWEVKQRGESSFLDTQAKNFENSGEQFMVLVKKVLGRLAHHDATKRKAGSWHELNLHPFMFVSI
jgi:hypothetical protein